MQEQIQMQAIKEPKMTTPEWTNEKHSMYLKSIEATFINQLYDSKHTQPSFSLKGTSKVHANTSGQFKVLHGGCWKRIKFERENPEMIRTNQRHDLTKNPWIQHYRSSNKQPAPSLLESVTSTTQFVDLSQRNGFSSSSLFHLCETHVSHDDMLCSDTEMSDQNFIDEEVEESEENNRSNVKKLKKNL
ncbi:hypothetical protein Lal_00003363 [Lupinus albus]|uniref:Uncharacterized protein n=1 Tax=Lupinus albus TaxID=3870 RepID=A0A6A4NPB6_LUPAL|nr:hypothetical protein Lalb_Chr22g0355111 [Lupinus albus]KAF1883180.1 hypothetical protein Lal_00003363 [Lupinus albus]